MGKITGFIEIHRAKAADAAGRGAAPATGSEVYLPLRRADLRSRARAAWTAAFRSATRAARSGNLIPDWNDLVYRDRWRRRSSGCTRPTTSRSSPGVCARRRAKARACSASTTIRSRSSASSRRSSTAPSTKAGSCRSRPSTAPARRSPSSGSGPAGLAAAEQLNRAGHTSPSSSAPTASAGCCATAFPSSRWRSASSIGGSKLMEAEGIDVPSRRQRRHRLTVETSARLRRHRARRRRRPGRATCPCRAASSRASTSRWST